MDDIRDYQLYKKYLNKFRYALLKMYKIKNLVKIYLKKKYISHKLVKDRYLRMIEDPYLIRGFSLSFSGKISRHSRSREIKINHGILDYQNVERVKDSAIIKRRSKFGLLTVRIYINYEFSVFWFNNLERKNIKNQYLYMNFISIMMENVKKKKKFYFNKKFF
jgi:hypothetical protein